MLLPKPDGDFAPAPIGNHPARCYRVIDLGTQQGAYMGKPKIQHKVMISWELFSDEKMQDGRNYMVSNSYTLSGSEKSRLRQHLESWRGRGFTEADWNTFHIEKLIGVPCLLQIVHDPKDGGGVYANISSIAGVPKGLTVPAMTCDPLFFSLDPKEYKPDAYAKLSDNLKLTIHKSPEWAELNRTPVEHDDGARNSMNDDIPF